MGVGINLNWQQKTEKNQPELTQPATALNLIIGKKVETEIFLGKYLAEFKKYYQQFLKRGFVAIGQEYRQRSFYLGQDVKINLPQGIVAGKAKKIDQNGALILQASDGLKTITMGDMLLF